MARPRPSDAGGPVATAARIADEVLFPSAVRTEAAGAVPDAHLALLAEAGLYGMAGPTSARGLALDAAAAGAVIEALAGGCLTTTFVWVQHHALVRAMANDAPPPLRDEWLEPLCRGERRAGVALAGLLPGPPLLRASPNESGWVVDGTSPWVTGWGHVDALLVAARGPAETAVWLVVDAEEGAGLTAAPRRLVAVDASATVALNFDRLVVTADRVVRVQPYGDVSGGLHSALRTNGSLALGLTGRCCRLVGPSRLDAELAVCRQALDGAGPDGIAEARAAASELAVRAAAAAVVAGGSSSVALDGHEQRLAREAVFLLVFGSRPAIRDALLRRLA